MATVTIFAASNGWGFVSFALGLLVGNSVASALAAYADPAQRTARLSLKSWRRMAEFGRYRALQPSLTNYTSPCRNWCSALP